jgi:hypothetical protein
MIQVYHSPSSAPLHEAVLFPFDDHAIPFVDNLRLHLIPGKKPGQKNPIVLPAGQPGEPDSAVVRYYGTVIRVGDELRMWYLGRGDQDDKTWSGGQLRLCYATSRDGVHWEKPKLGLCEYNGSKQNNLVHFLPEHGLAAAPILYEPDDPDPHRRFKLAFESEKYANCLAVAFSPDGIRWTEYAGNPLTPTMLEQAGIVKFNGCYYVNGQGGRHFGSGRKLVTFASYDFEHWTQSSALGLMRSPRIATDPERDKWNQYEEVHLGASLWNRGNVLLGVYGQWHGHPSGDRRYVGIDLGLVVSNDALHYREPIPDFRFLPAYEELETPLGREPALNQGQGFENFGEKTLFWYEVWGLGPVRLATWERDRLGYFQSMGGPAHWISCPLRLNGSAQFALNVGGLSEHTELRVELLDEQFRPLPGYSGEAAASIRTNGLRQLVTWGDQATTNAFSHPIRVQVHFGGVRPEDIRFYAAYLMTLTT